MTALKRSFEDQEQAVRSWFPMVDYLHCEQAVSPRDWIYAIVTLDAMRARMEAAETERDSIKRLFNAVKELVK